ncbi:MAG: YdbH domain-containing protein [Zymomonas mobilis subsp. pomaceae]
MTHKEIKNHRLTKKHLWLLAGVILGGLLVGLWSQRIGLGRWLISREANRLHLKAHYRLTRLDPMAQQLDNLVIGDSYHPDLTAKHVIIHVMPTWRGLQISSIDLDTVRIQGHLDKEGIHFGSLDSLRSYLTTAGASSGLPIINLHLKDVRLRLRTPNGNIGIAMDGNGNLANGFQARLAASMPHFSSNACTAEKGQFFLNASVVHGRPFFQGPATAQNIRCNIGYWAVQNPKSIIEGHFNKALNNWQGTALLSAYEMASFNGAPWQLSALKGHLALKGNDQKTQGRLEIAGKEDMPWLTGGSWDVSSVFNIPFKYSHDSQKNDPFLTTTHISLHNGQIKNDLKHFSISDDIPLSPIVKQLKQALSKIAENISGETDITLDNKQGALKAALHKVLLTSPSGQSAQFLGAASWQAHRKEQPWDLKGDLNIKGQGLPTTKIHLLPVTNGIFKGKIEVAPYRDDQNQTSLQLTPVNFYYDKQHFLVATEANITGSLGKEEQVESLTIPLHIEGSNDQTLINKDCMTVHIARVTMAGITGHNIALPLCPVEAAFLQVRKGQFTNGGFQLEKPTITGEINNQPFTIKLKSSFFSLARHYGEVSDLTFDEKGATGQDDTHLHIEHVTGNLAGIKGAGDLTGISGHIGLAPLIMSNGAAHWEWQNKGGALESQNNSDIVLHGGVDIADANQASPRFLPMRAQDLLLQINKERIHITAGLERQIGMRWSHILDSRIEHHFSDGRGHVVLHVNGVAFDKTLQPEQITPLTLGVFADVRGIVQGEGRIDWSNKGVISTGDFKSDNLDFAVAFGTISGFNGKIHFSDLLNLKTPPEQIAGINEINAGIAIKDGKIHYQILPEKKIVIEKGIWPFFDGQLALDQAVLDFSHTAMHRVTFHVTNMDSAPLVDNLEMKNLFVSGRFDGILPLEFGSNSGKIEGGHLISRDPGGVVSYVGTVSNAHQGMLSKLTFDVLKGLRYKQLDIVLNGNLDGDFISSIHFGGVKEVKTTGSRSYLAREIEKVPFHFNVQVKAPFRGLLNAMRSYNDPRSVLNQSQL